MKASEGFNPGESSSIAGLIDEWCSGICCPSGPPKLMQKTNQNGWFFRYFMPVFVTKIGLFLCYAPRGRKIVVFYRGRDY